MTEQESRAVEILRGYGDAACYEEMVQTILRGMAEIIEAKEMGVLIRNTRAGLYMLAGHVPFCQVVPSNGASRALQQRLGMTEAKGMLYWLTDDTF